jgi:hypothetical protein
MNYHNKTCKSSMYGVLGINTLMIELEISFDIPLTLTPVFL